MAVEPFLGPDEAKPDEGPATAEDPIAELTFEKAMEQLERIVQQLERGQLDLESSIRAYERGTALRQHCAAKLKEVRLRVEKITQDQGGKVKLAAFED